MDNIAPLLRELEEKQRAAAQELVRIEKLRASISEDLQDLERALAGLRPIHQRWLAAQGVGGAPSASPSAEHSVRDSPAAVMRVASEDPDKVWHIKEITEAVVRRGWIPAHIGHPLEWVRHGANQLGRQGQLHHHRAWYSINRDEGAIRTFVLDIAASQGSADSNGHRLVAPAPQPPPRQPEGAAM